ncbi:MFS transporter [Streptomyces sp. NPDC001219]
MSVIPATATRRPRAVDVLRSRPGRAVGSGYFAQGFGVAAVFTTVPTVREHFGFSGGAMTGLLVGVSLAAGAGSFAGSAVIRRYGATQVLRPLVLALAVAPALLSWAPGRTAALCAYLLFGLVLGGVDVTLNTRAAVLERRAGHSVFSSFYAVAAGAGILAALATAGAAHAGWSFRSTLALQALAVALLAMLAAARPAPPGAADRPAAASGAGAGVLGRNVWARLVPLGIVLLFVYVIDSTMSAWATVYLHQTLHASLATAPLAYAAYQTGTVLGRSFADALVHRLGPGPVIRCFALVTALGLAALALAPQWVPAVPAAGVVGLGTSVLVPLTVAAAGRLRPDATDSLLARLNVFNYIGVVSGGALSGVLGAGGHFRLAFALPAGVALLLPLACRCFLPQDG